MADTAVADGRTNVRTTWLEAPTAAKALVIGTFVHRLGGFLQVFLVLYLTSRGFSTGRAGLALGVFGAGMVVGVLVGGWLSDRLGPRRTIIGTTTLTAAFLPAVLYLDGYPVLLAAIGLIGAVSQAYRPASTSMLSQLVPQDRHVMIFAMVRLATNLGTTAGPLLGAALAAVSYDLLFWGEGLAALAFGGVAAVALPRTAVGGAVKSDAAAGGTYLDVLSDRRYLLFLFALMVNSLIYIQYIATLPLSVRANHMSTMVYAVLVALNGLVVVTCELLIAKRVQHWSRRAAALVGVALTAIGMAGYGFHWGLIGFVVATLLWSFGETVGYPTLYYAYPAQAGPPHLRGRYLGASNSLYGLASAVGPVAGIAAWNALGDDLWLWCGVVGLIALAATWVGVAPPRSADLPRPAPDDERTLNP
ncbi:MAG TPA: MFS transporter [Planosporangium sp.]|nr:MFS transporter [Planosporangium sp.]